MPNPATPTDDAATNDANATGGRPTEIADAPAVPPPDASGDSQVRTLTAELETLRKRLVESERTVETLERRQKIDGLLGESDAIDVEAARLLTEQAVTEMDEPDVALAIEDLRRHRPYLFRRRPAGGAAGDAASQASVMAPRFQADSGAAHAADRAIQTGDRRDLLAYLRMRRRG